jgi:preprotein translocase subunit SecA
MCCHKCVDGDCDRCPKSEKTAGKCVADMPCGLHIIGTERHESRRIDRQLRGRSGRQGDPGSSRFFLSLEDDLMRLFGSDRLSGVISRLGLKEGDAIEHSLITRQIERAQRRVEANNFSIRKHLLEYDDVMNKQREVVYDKRLLALESEDISGEIRNMIDAVAERQIGKHAPKGAHPEDWDLDGMKREFESLFVRPLEAGADRHSAGKAEPVDDMVKNAALSAYEAKQKEVGLELIKNFERSALLYNIDSKWRDHLYELDSVRAGIGLRAYGQKDPLIEYKAEAYDLFVKMMDEVELETVSLIFHSRWVKPGEERALRPVAMREVKPDIMMPREPVGAGIQASDLRGGHRQAGSAGAVSHAGRVRSVGGAKVGRNDPCPCGSGKKYKKCCGS